MESPHRAQIELGLIFGTPLRVLSKRYGRSVSSLQAHRLNHLTPQLKAAVLMARKPEEVDLELLARTEGESVISNLVMQRARLARLAELATEQGMVHQAVACERGVTDNLRLMSQLLGQLVQHHQITKTSVLISTDYIALRQTILRALKRFPEAACVVGEELAKLEGQAAQEVVKSSTLLLEAQPC